MAAATLMPAVIATSVTGSRGSSPTIVWDSIYLGAGTTAEGLALEQASGVWAFELGAPNALFRRGWRKDSIGPGIELMITGFRGKSGRPIANGRTIKFADGRELFAGSSGTGAPLDGADPTEKR